MSVALIEAPDLTPAGAERFVADAERRLHDAGRRLTRADWIATTYIIPDTAAILRDAERNESVPY